MIKQYKLAEIAVQDILNRDIREEHDVEAVVDEIMAKVRVDGDAALLEYEQRFDKAQLEALQVSEAEIAEAVASLILFARWNWRGITFGVFIANRCLKILC